MASSSLRLALVIVLTTGVFPTREFLPVASASTPTTQRQFSGDERARLLKGELVVRRIAQRRGRFDLVGGSSWQIINAPPQVVWRALLDTPYYRRTLPAVIEAKLIKDRGSQRTVFLRQGSRFVQITNYLRLSIRADRKELDFCLDDKLPHSIKAGWGFFAVRPYGKNRSVLAYGVMVDVGENLIAELFRGTTREWMLKVPWLVKRFIEGKGKSVYKY